MKQSDIKRVVGQLEPDQGMEYRLAEQLQHRPRRRPMFRPAAAFAAVGVAVLLGVGVIVGNVTGTNASLIRQAGIDIPKVELPENGEASAKMMPLIVYQGRVYLLSATQIDPQLAQQFLGDKIGTTKGGLTEWSKQQDYAVEFASTIGVQDVYTVAGYDKSFRLMTLETLDGVSYPQIFECLNGITVRTGEDVFGKLKIQGNVDSVQYEKFESWNNGLQQVDSLADLSGVDPFIDALYRSAPVKEEQAGALWEDQSADSQKFAYVTLKDKSVVQLRLFRDGYVYYNGLSLYFKVDQTAFDNFWDALR